VPRTCIALSHTATEVAGYYQRSLRDLITGSLLDFIAALNNYGSSNTSSSNIVAKKIRVIGVPLDLGQSRRGVDMGLRGARGRTGGATGRTGHVVEDAGIFPWPSRNRRR